MPSGDWELIGFGAWGILVVSLLVFRIRRGRFFKVNSGFDDLEAFAGLPGERKADRAIAAVEVLEAEQEGTEHGAARADSGRKRSPSVQQDPDFKE